MTLSNSTRKILIYVLIILALVLIGGEPKPGPDANTVFAVTKILGLIAVIGAYRLWLHGSGD